MSLKKWAKEKRKMIYFGGNKAKEKSKQCYHDDICRWKRDSFSSEFKITRGHF